MATIDLTASNALSLTQSGSRARLLSLSASNTLALTQSASISNVKVLTASNTLALSQSGTVEKSHSGAQTLNLTQSATRTVDRGRTASNKLDLTHTFTTDGGVTSSCERTPGRASTRIYSPIVGENTDPDSTAPSSTAPTLTRREDVEFFWPSNNPSEVVTIRAPNFGDRDRFQVTRINRESRGGSLRIFADSDWPTQRVLIVDFSVIKEDTAQSLLDFLRTNLGKEIGFRDWQDRVWTGVVLAPDSAIVRTRPDSIDLSIEMMVNPIQLLVTEDGLVFSDDGTNDIEVV